MRRLASAGSSSRWCRTWKAESRALPSVVTGAVDSGCGRCCDCNRVPGRRTDCNDGHPASIKGGCRQPPDCLGIRSFSAWRTLSSSTRGCSPLSSPAPRASGLHHRVEDMVALLIFGRFSGEPFERGTYCLGWLPTSIAGSCRTVLIFMSLQPMGNNGDVAKSK
jgi:hypothetical protein